MSTRGGKGRSKKPSFTVLDHMVTSEEDQSELVSFNSHHSVASASEHDTTREAEVWAGKLSQVSAERVHKLEAL